LALTTSPLPVTSGGTGTATAFTAGSVVFAGASGVYSQKNANFFWDNTNNRLGVNTATPSNDLEVAGTIRTSSGANYALFANNFLRSYASGTFFFDNFTVGQSFVWRVSSASALDTTAMTMASTGNITVNTGNLIPATAAKGVNFTANTPAAGMTSQLLNWYEDGTWTPTITPSTSGSVVYTTQSGTYTRVGRQVTIVFIVAGTKGTSSGDYRIGGIPFNISGSAITGAINWYNPSGTALVNAVAFYLSSTQFRVGVITAANTDATAGTFGSGNVSSIFSLTGTLTYFV
jgi:hypothetical protein